MESDNTKNVASTSGVKKSGAIVIEEPAVVQFLVRYKYSLLAAVLCVVLAIVGVTFYSSYKTKYKNEMTALISEFELSSLAKLKKGEVNSADYKVALEALVKKTANYPGALALMLASSDHFVEKKELAQAKDVLLLAQKSYSSHNHYIDFFIYTRLVPVLEDLQDYKGALETLEKIKNLSMKILEGKTYLDLGRMHLLLNDKMKAKANFQYVVDNYPNDEFAKVAKIYLSQI